jgi:hypothetical protein
MFRYYYINKEWILSAAARRIYRISASLSLILFLILWALGMHVPVPPGVLPMVKLLLFLGVVGAAITLVAMEYFFFGFDNTAVWKKVFWFFMLLIPPLGPPLYCFIVYSRSNLLMSDPSVGLPGSR